MIPTFLA